MCITRISARLVHEGMIHRGNQMLYETNQTHMHAVCVIVANTGVVYMLPLHGVDAKPQKFTHEF